VLGAVLAQQGLVGLEVVGLQGFEAKRAVVVAARAAALSAVAAEALARARQGLVPPCLPVLGRAQPLDQGRAAAHDLGEKHGAALGRGARGRFGRVGARARRLAREAAVGGPLRHRRDRRLLALERGAQLALAVEQPQGAQLGDYGGAGGLAARAGHVAADHWGGGGGGERGGGRWGRGRRCRGRGRRFRRRRRFRSSVGRQQRLELANALAALELQQALGLARHYLERGPQQACAHHSWHPRLWRGLEGR
jgi:hypothetical protein